MRVVGGIYRSRKINEVKSDKTRPTTDKNKESLFNSIGQYFDGDIFLDLFSGSGALGIEAISRGAKSVDFVDNSNLAIKTIKENLNSLQIKNGAFTYKQDAFQFLNTTNKEYDVILVDPPYALEKYNEILEIIETRHLLNIDGIIVLEADKSTVLPEKYGSLYKYKEKTLGNTKFGFYEVEE